MNKFLMMLMVGSAFSAVSTHALTADGFYEDKDIVTLQTCKDVMGPAYANIVSTIRYNKICNSYAGNNKTFAHLKNEKGIFAARESQINRYMSTHKGQNS